MSELTLVALRLGFVLALWIFVIAVVLISARMTGFSFKILFERGGQLGRQGRVDRAADASTDSHANLVNLGVA